VKSLAIVSFFFVLLTMAQTANAADWVELGETVWGTYHYDRASVRQMGRFVTVTSKQMLNARMAAAVEAAFPETKGVAYVVNYDLIDCEEGLYRQNSVVYYDRHGRVLHDSELTKKQYREPAPRPIPPDTPIGWLAETVCEDEVQEPPR
jgi:hypothetical protein